MSFSDQIYELPVGAKVEIQLKDTTLKGEVNVLVQGTTRNPEADIVILERPVEVPSGKQRNGTESFPVKDVININVLEYGIFKKHHVVDTEANSPSSQSNVSTRSYNNKGFGYGHGGSSKGSVASKKNKKSQEMKDLEPVEIMLRTFIIKEESKLKHLMKLLKDVPECGMSFEGQNVGRHGVVAWIILVAGKTLIPVDIDTLSEKVPDLWKILEIGLFRNVKLTKIMHDSREAADYLLHAHGIRMINVFDTQVAAATLYRDIYGQIPQQLDSLSDCLPMYNKRIPMEELEFLSKYERFDFSTNSPMLKKPLPPPEYLKLCALKVKHLVPLRENLLKRMLEKLEKCTEAHMDSYRTLPKEKYSAMPKDGSLSHELVAALEDGVDQLII